MFRDMGTKHPDLSSLPSRKARAVLFVRLLDHFAAQPPMVTYGQLGWTDLYHGAVHSILGRKNIFANYPRMMELLEVIRFDGEEKSKDDVRCGVQLLKYFGHMAEQLDMAPGAGFLSVEKALLLLIDWQDRQDPLIEFVSGGREIYYVEVTELGRQRLGVHGRIRIIQSRPTYELYDRWIAKERPHSYCTAEMRAKRTPWSIALAPGIETF